MADVRTEKIGIILNGVTGRMGTNQHLMRSIVAIIAQGGVKLADGSTVTPDPVLVGRNEEKLKKLVELSGVQKFTSMHRARTGASSPSSEPSPPVSTYTAKSPAR
jgi:hypothetical protein